MNKNDKRQHDELMTDIWLSSCDVGQQSMVNTWYPLQQIVVNVSYKSSQPQVNILLLILYSTYYLYCIIVHVIIYCTTGENDATECTEIYYGINWTKFSITGN